MNDANEEKENENEENTIKRSDTWSHKFDFILNLFGMSIGLGNVWRFPYLCYKNGGGVFLVAYFTLVLLIVIPMIILEVSVGQFTGKSTYKAWKLVPIMRGIGMTGPILMFFNNLYYPVLLAWALRWMVAGFSTESPWISCENTWNSDTCFSIVGKQSFNETNVTLLEMNNTEVERNIDLNETARRLSSVEEFWRNNILDISSGIEEPGGVKWDLFGCLLIIWILVYFAIWKGIGWTSKVVYVTATLPLVMVIVVLVRGVTLDGAAKGISVYLRPNVTKLKNVEMWIDALSQVMYSYSLGCGTLVSLGSHNEVRHNLIRDCLIFCAANAATSFTAGFAIFSVLGFLANVKNTTIDAVAESGPGLVYVVYPTALSFLPLPNFWIVVFFMMLILLGFDGQFVFQEALLQSVKDIMPRKLLKYKWNHEICHAVLIVVMFILGIPMVTRGGMYLLNLYNSYSVAGWCIYFIVASEAVALSWIFGHKRWLDNMEKMVGNWIPRIWLTISWKFVTPFILILIMGYSLFLYKPLTYDRTYTYPVWADVFGWITAFSSVLWIPGIAIYVAYRSQRERIQNTSKCEVNSMNLLSRNA